MIKDNILKIRGDIALACPKIGKDTLGVSIIAVTKSRAIEQIKEAVESGLTEIGENKVQEAVLKYNLLSTSSSQFQAQGSKLPADDSKLRAVKWHMIGHLQTNKVKDAVKIFDLIQSVDSLHLAFEINKQSAKIDKVQDILIQVNVSGEPAKFGLKPGEVADITRAIAQLKNINVKGLMTVAPIMDNPEKVRPYFRMLRQLKDELNNLMDVSRRLSILSMGMTDDFKIAIEEGANMVRLGRAVFEDK